MQISAYKQEWLMSISTTGSAYLAQMANVMNMKIRKDQLKQFTKFKRNEFTRLEDEHYQ